jgi:aminoglycoside phosphotransferase (APT) family kinase protein
MAACQATGLDAGEAELIRLGSNAVFRLKRCSVVARVARGACGARGPASATRAVAVSEWLASENVPAIRAFAVPQPVVVDGRVVTFWEEASDREEYGSITELAQLLRRLHSLTPPAELHLPAVAPFDRVAWRLDHAQAVCEDDRAFLRERGDQLSKAYADLVFELPAGVVHGDANVGNVIRDRTGGALLSDLDGFAVGPREWDLVLTAAYYERFGWHSEAEYRAFTDAYGYDVMRWPGYLVLRDVREFLMVTWLAQNASESLAANAELTKRLGALRSDASRRDWKPF